MDLRQTIIAEMKVKTVIQPEVEIQTRVDFIKKTLSSTGLKTLVLGISGGIDSCTCGKLAQIAVEQLNTELKTNSYQFVAIRLPYGEQADEADAQASIDFISPAKSLSVNIKSSADALHTEVLGALMNTHALPENDAQQDFAKGNVKARTRMVAQYDVAGILGGLVLGTDHSAENITGFYTKYGDGGVDISPIADCNKTEVWELGKELGILNEIIEAAPTDGLWDDGRTDEGQLGLQYHELEEAMNNPNSPNRAKYETIRKQNLHKMEPIPVCKIPN